MWFKSLKGLKREDSYVAYVFRRVPNSRHTKFGLNRLRGQRVNLEHTDTQTHTFAFIYKKKIVYAALSRSNIDCLRLRFIFSVGLLCSQDLLILELSFYNGRAMAQVVSRRHVTAEARVCARVNPCGICSGQSGSGTGFPPSSSVFPCQYHSAVALQLMCGR
jgi:hypothetical protein